MEVTPKGILKVHISEGVIEDIQLVGNDKTKDKVILRELKMKKGKPFNKFQQAAPWKDSIIWATLKMST